jgi:hypothetical protein
MRVRWCGHGRRDWLRVRLLWVKWACRQFSELIRRRSDFDCARVDHGSECAFSVAPRTVTGWPGWSSPCTRSASGGDIRTIIPVSSTAPFTSPRLPCNGAVILPLVISSPVDRSGAPGGPLSTTDAPVAKFVTEAASTSCSARTFGPRMVTASPGRTAKTSWLVRCGGSVTSVPSFRIHH